MPDRGVLAKVSATITTTTLPPMQRTSRPHTSRPQDCHMDVHGLTSNNTHMGRARATHTSGPYVVAHHIDHCVCGPPLTRVLVEYPWRVDISLE